MKRTALALYLLTTTPVWGQDLTTQQWEDMSLIIETEATQIEEFYADDFKSDPNPDLNLPDLEPLSPTKVEPMFDILILTPSMDIE